MKAVGSTIKDESAWLLSATYSVCQRGVKTGKLVIAFCRKLTSRLRSVTSHMGSYSVANSGDCASP